MKRTVQFSQTVLELSNGKMRDRATSTTRQEDVSARMAKAPDFGLRCERDLHWSPTGTIQKYAEAARLLHTLGRYDHNVIGATAEVYAVEVLGMRNAPIRTPYIDGWLNGQRVQVKVERLGAHSDAGTYVTINRKARDQIDDLVILYVGDDGQLGRGLF